jgi:hypothetical protein
MAFESLLAYSRFFGEGAVNRREQSRNSVVAALDARQGDVYSEETFRHFLGMERLRAARSNREFFLLLVSLRRCPERGVRLSPALATPVLSGLGVCVREVDFIGWYRRERVVGAVLAQGYGVPDSQASHRIVERVARALGDRLPKSAADRLRVRVVRLGGRAQ